MQFERILRNILIGGVFLVPFIPLIIANSMFFPFITGKNFAFRILVELLFGGWVILAFLRTAYRPRFSWLLVSVAAFVGIITLADIFGEDPWKSFWSNFERMDGLITLLHLFAYFVVVQAVLNTEKLWNRFWNTSVGVSVFMGFYGILQLAGLISIRQGGDRLDGTFGNATYLAVYMLFHIFITMILLARWRGASWVRYLYGAIVALQLLIIYFTATRSSILGLIGGALLATLLIAIFERERTLLRKAAVGIMIGIVVFVGGFIAIRNTSFVQDNYVLSRFGNLTLSEAPQQARYYVWPMAFEGFKEHPILGWGQENFNLVFNEYYRPALHSQEPWFDRVHNIILDWLIAGGVLGFLAYIAIPLVLLYYIWRRDSRVYFSVVERSLLTGLLAGYFFHNLFVFDNIISYVLYFSVVAYVGALVAKPFSDESFFMHEVDRGVALRLVAPLVIVVVLFGAYTLNWKGYATSQTLIRALSPQGDIAVNLELFKRAAAYETLGSQEVAEQVTQFANNVAGADVDLSFKQTFLDLGVEELSEELERAPDDARLNLFLGVHLARFGQLAEAFPYIERAHELSPRKQTILFELAFNYLNRGETTRAVELLRKAFELEPTFDQARLLYAAAAIYNDNFALAEKLLTDRFGTAIVDNDQILQAYGAKGRYDLTRDIWLLRIEKNPLDVQAHLSLAATYYALGQSELAIEAIRKAAALDTSLRGQAEQLIQEIEAELNLETP